MGYNNIQGMHLAFYYCGISHLLVNLLKHIKAGVKNNELICISCEKDIYTKILEFVEKNDIETSNIKFISGEPLITAHKNGGLTTLKEKQDEYVDMALEKGYSGIRWIGQPTYAIKQTSKRDFLNLEKDLCASLKGGKMSLVCVYDFYDFMNEKKVIDTDVMKNSQITHIHTLYKFNIQKTNEIYG